MQSLSVTVTLELFCAPTPIKAKIFKYSHPTAPAPTKNKFKL